MRRRLYFLIPNVPEAKKVFEGLLLRRVPINHIWVVAKEGVDIDDLPEASVFQKTDLLHGMMNGIWIGALIGIIAGFIGHGLLNMPLGGGILATTLIGAVLGAWSASMIGMMVPNGHHKAFQQAIKRGEILMLVDIPKERVEEIHQFVNGLSPQSHYEGVEPTIPRFP